MADPARDVAPAVAPHRDLDWDAVEKVRIVGHDGSHARLVCLRCPADQPTYGVRGSLAGVIHWAIEHYHFMHQTQVAARE